MLVFTPQRLHEISMAVFRAAGTDEEPARIVADHLVHAHLTGHDSHGIVHIPGYVAAIKRGALMPNARPVIVRETAVTALVDAQQTFGHVSTLFATDVAIARAKEHGVAVVGVYHGHHIGRLGHYPTRAAAQGVALLVAMGDLGRSAAPFGGRAGALGTNPITFGFPVGTQGPDGDEANFMLDFATTVVAGGKVMVARDAHNRVPPNVLIDNRGQLSTDPAAFFAGGALLPFGGHKGFALSMMTMLLSRVLIRAGGDSGARESKTFLLALDAGVLDDGDAVAAEARSVIEQVKEVPPAEGFDEVLIPGEPERRTADRRRAAGIPVAEDTWKALAATASELGVAV